MDDLTKDSNLRLLEEAKERINSVRYNMDELTQGRFSKRADTIIVKILNLMDDIRSS